MELIDTHCHLTFEPLSDDIDSVVTRSKNSGIHEWITVGTDSEHNKKAVELAGRFDSLYAAVGIHPHYARDMTLETAKELKQFAQSEKVVAIGETGFDFHYGDSPKYQDQKRLFVQHLIVAKELNLPVIIHSRDAFDQTMDTLEQFGREIPKIVFHCFSYSAQQAKAIVDKGFFVSFTGSITFKNAASLREAAESVPTERIMLETDCPYMSPEPLRKQKINEPAFMVHTVKYLAGLKKTNPEALAAIITATSRNFFGLPSR